ncbi:MAG TPA: VCBS repeat-containing protein, partial [Pyrinomonadaceae bacterium]
MKRRFVLLLSLIVLLSADAFAQCSGDVFIAPRRQRVGELLNKNAAADFDGDGLADAAIADHYSNRIFVMKGDGAGNLGAPKAYETGLNPLDLEKSDFDGDGFVDLISANSGDGTVSLFFGARGGEFSAATNLTIGGAPT